MLKYDALFAVQAAKMRLLHAVRSGNRKSLGWHMASASQYVRTARASDIEERRRLANYLVLMVKNSALPAPWWSALAMLETAFHMCNADDESPPAWRFLHDKLTVNHLNYIPVHILYCTENKSDPFESFQTCHDILDHQINVDGLIHGQYVP